MSKAMQDKGVVRRAMEEHRGLSKAREGMVRKGKNIWGRVEKVRQSKAGVGKEVRIIGEGGNARQGQEKSRRKVKVGDG